MLVESVLVEFLLDALAVVGLEFGVWLVFGVFGVCPKIPIESRL